jgi:hypothetical protein
VGGRPPQGGHREEPGNRGSVAARSAGSTNPPPWLATTSTGPSSGTCSGPVCSTVRNHPRVVADGPARARTPRERAHRRILPRSAAATMAA